MICSIKIEYVITCTCALKRGCKQDRITWKIKMEYLRLPRKRKPISEKKETKKERDKKYDQGHNRISLSKEAIALWNNAKAEENIKNNTELAMFLLQTR